MNILIIEHAPERSRGIKETIRKFLNEVNFIEVKTYKTAEYPSNSCFDLVVLSGGPMGVYEINKSEYSFLKKEIAFIKKALKQKKAFLGICFGHQLLAYILGGKVIEDKVNEEIGWFDVKLNKNGQVSLLFEGVNKSFKIFQYHKDKVKRPPENTVVLAESKKCEIQALKYTNLPIFTVQFHPEIGSDLGKKIFSRMRENLTAKGFNVDKLIKNADFVNEKARIKLFQNFLESIDYSN